MQMARLARIQGRPAQVAEPYNVATKNPKSSQSAEEVECSLVKNKKGVESSVSNFSGNDNFAELGQRRGGRTLQRAVNCRPLRPLPCDIYDVVHVSKSDLCAKHETAVMNFRCAENDAERSNASECKVLRCRFSLLSAQGTPCVTTSGGSDKCDTSLQWRCSSDVAVLVVGGDLRREVGGLLACPLCCTRPWSKNIFIRNVAPLWHNLFECVICCAVCLGITSMIMMSLLELSSWPLFREGARQARSRRQEARRAALIVPSRNRCGHASRGSSWRRQQLGFGVGHCWSCVLISPPGSTSISSLAYARIVADFWMLSCITARLMIRAMVTTLGVVRHSKLERRLVFRSRWHGMPRTRWLERCYTCTVAR